MDLVLRVENTSLLIPSLKANMYMNAQWADLGDGDLRYRELTKGEIEGATFEGTSPLVVNELGGFQKNKVYGIRTTEGLYAKIYVSNITSEYQYLRRSKIWRVALKYTVFEN